ncbi:serine/threonine-protein kinase [Paludisphaera soli]|uniref:serine/threonine-protein kinase n=1 Tax=Paludisphaera soli TaxID=2712865 RepID=UPI0013EC02A6|nr:serine/threonine-protein kinase [Paludisphaera soli]
MNTVQLDEEAIFDVARKIADREARAAYLAQVCGGDAALARRVERLVRVGEQEADFLVAPACDVTVDMPAEAERPGVMVGPYKLLEPIGEGGMGSVYMAEQTEPVRRKVALKVIKPGMDSKQVVARFESERQALALMDHPNIARVLDAGATGSGRPYFVMELVRGVSITEYCDREQLPVAARLELFVLVCRAVQHAHQKGVIHRDLKPSNILVTMHDGVPVPKVIDFGIAKATGQSLTEKTLFTGFAQLVGTPLYMSPEQAEMSGLDVDTRSDIYSLGVLLYELLTGTTPFDSETLRKAAFDEMRRIIREEDPPRPSTRLSALGQTLTTVSAMRGSDPRRLNRSVRGELDWIAMKALDKDRRRRYETAGDFAADVLNYLADRPVEACPPSAGYRLKKSARKHRRLLAATASFLALLVAGTAVSAWQAVRATTAATAERRANQTANRRLAQLESANGILASIFKDLDPESEEKEGKPLRALLGERLDRATRDLQGAAVGDPLAVAKLQLTLGNSQLGLGYKDKAGDLFTKAHATFLAEAGPGDPDAIACVAGLFRAYSHTGKLRAAVPWFEGTVTQARTALGREHPATLAYMDNLAWAYHYTVQIDRSIALFEETLRLRTAALGRGHRDTLDTMYGLATAYRSARKLSQAVALFEETIRLREAALGPGHPDTLAAMHHLAWSLMNSSTIDRAVRLFEEELRRHTAASGPRHPRTLGCMNDLATAHTWSGRPDQGLRMYEEVYRGRKATLGAEHPATLGSMSNLASAYFEAGKVEEGLRMKEEALGVARAKWGDRHHMTLTLMHQLGSAYRHAGKVDRAIAQLEEALRQYKAEKGAEDAGAVEIMVDLAAAYREVGRPDDAVAMLEAVLGAYTATDPGDRQGLYWSYASELASAYREAGRPERAVTLRREALERARAELGPEHDKTLSAMSDLAREYQLSGEPGRGDPLVEEAFRVTKDKLGPDATKTLGFMSGVALHYQKSGRLDKALPLFEEALRLAKARSTPDDLFTFDRLDQLAEAYIEARRDDDALQLTREMLAVARRRLPAGDRMLPGVLSRIARRLSRLGHAAEAEPLLREGLAILQKSSALEWQTPDAQSMLGGALLDQGKHAEAEPLLLQGYEGLERKKAGITAFERRPLAEAAERLVRLYEATGRPEEAAKWREQARAEPGPDATGPPE